MNDFQIKIVIRMMKNKLFAIICFLFMSTVVLGQQNTLTNDGAWCWFSAPNAIYKHNGKAEIVTGWVTSDGSIEAATLNLKTKKSYIQSVSPKLNKDDHANPSFIELDNKDVLMFYAKHFDKAVRMNKLSAAGDSKDFGATSFKEVFSEEQFKLYPRKCVTYANPIALKKEKNRLFCFGRWTGFKPNMMWSDDNGETFNPAQVFITNQPFNDDNRPYVRYYSDGKSKIHIIFTDGHPRKESTNSVYYACYEKGAFWKADGTKICNLDEIPFEPKDATMVYKATKESGRAWVYDVSADKKGNPIILYARYPKETEHLYHYAQFLKGKWVDNQICNAGKWFPQTPEGEIEREPHYSAGLTFHPLQGNTIYLSREINGVFEIEKRVTPDHGKTWAITPLTQNSKYDNVRPVVPKNMKKGDKTVVLWMVNEKYIHYTDFKSRIEYVLD